MQSQDADPQTAVNHLQLIGKQYQAQSCQSSNLKTMHAEVIMVSHKLQSETCIRW